MQMRDNIQSYHVSPKLHVNPSPCSCPSVFLSLRSIPRWICTINCVCVSCLPLPPSYASSPPLPSLICTLWQLCWWWLCAHGASWLRGPRWPTWQLLMFRCSTPLTQRPWSNTHMHTRLQINIEARCARMYALCGCSRAYTEVRILPHVAGELRFNKVARTRDIWCIWLPGSSEQQLSAW